MKYILIISLMLLWSCDPALRLQIVNETQSILRVELEEIDCNPLAEYINERKDSLGYEVILDKGENNQYTFFLGIGGWNKEDIDFIRKCLEEVIFMDDTSVSRSHKIYSEIELKEFGNSLMTFRVKLD